MKKRRGGHLSSNKKQKARKKNPGLAAFEEEFGSIKDYGQEAWNELSQEVVNELSKKVVSVASFIGNEMYVGCTGIVVRSNEAGAWILTSASLVKSVDDGRKMRSIAVEVRLPNNEVTGGRVTHYDLHYNIAIIIIPPFPGFRTASFDVPEEFGLHSTKLVAVGCWFYSGKFIATTGISNDEPIGVYPEHLRSSTCKIPTVMTGGPLVDLDGIFVGMNFYCKKRTPFRPTTTPFLPSCKIFDILVHEGVIEHEGPELILESSYESPCRSEIEHEVPELILKKESERPVKSLLCNSEGTSGDESESEEFMDVELLLPPDCRKPLPDDEFLNLVRNDLRSLGYCMPTRLESGMCLVNTFEQEFVKDSWCKLSNKIASNIRRSVVSLASFKGEERFFACTGIIIDCNGSTSRVLTSASLIRSSADENKIDDELEIKVHLPNKQQMMGTLQHYNLSYNIAVVRIMGFRCLRTAEFHNEVQIEPQREVVAFGRIFESGKLMATSGIVACKESELDCKELMISTCKITKAGIGGPLVDVDGNFVGMNFYGKKETHFLPRNIILKLLKHCGAERAVTGEAMDSKPNRWPVPVPRWSYPSSRTVWRWRRPRPE